MRRSTLFSFEDAKMVFNDRFEHTVPDPLHSESEERFVTMGMAPNGELLVVVHTDREERIRIISAEGRRQQNEDDMKKQLKDEAMLPEYDFSGAVVGVFDIEQPGTRSAHRCA